MRAAAASQPRCPCTCSPKRSGSITRRASPSRVGTIRERTPDEVARDARHSRQAPPPETQPKNQGDRRKSRGSSRGRTLCGLLGGPRKKPIGGDRRQLDETFWCQGGRCYASTWDSLPRPEHGEKVRDDERQRDRQRHARGARTRL